MLFWNRVQCVNNISIISITNEGNENKKILCSVRPQENALTLTQIIPVKTNVCIRFANSLVCENACSKCVMKRHNKFGVLV